MDNKEKKFLTAEEAKYLAETSEHLKNLVYKLIKESAKENRSELHFDINELSVIAVSNLTKLLEENGYRVVNYNNMELIISWR